MFGKWPWEVDSLPFHRFARVRRYFLEVKRQEAEALKPKDDPDLAGLQWDSEVVTSLE